MWIALYIASVLALIIWRKGRNTVWGSATAGLVVRVAIAAYSASKSGVFFWPTITRAIAIGVLCGVAIELVTKIYIRMGRVI